MNHRLVFVVESGTDVRLVEGLAERFDLHLVARTIPAGVPVSQRPSCDVDMTVGPAGRVAFARFVGRTLRALAPRADAVLVQGYGLAALAANRFARATSTPTFMLVCSPVETYYRCRRGRAYPGKPYRPTELWALMLAARVNARLGRGYVVLSQHLADVVRGHGTRAPVHVIPVYGVDCEYFRPPETARADLRRRLDLPERGTVVFYSSRVAPEKDAETLLDAVRRLREAGDDVWVLHRSGGYQAFLADAERYNVRDRIIAADARHPHEGLREDYQAATLCVQASRAEGLGFSPLEALACETPVVASDVGGLRETIVPGQTGWLYPAGDAEALARAIRDVATQPDEAARRARRGREMVKRRFGRQQVFARLVEVLT